MTWKRVGEHGRAEPRWVLVHTKMRCAQGHDVAAGMLVRFAPGGSVPTCAPCCISRYGITPPRPREGDDV